MVLIVADLETHIAVAAPVTTGSATGSDWADCQLTVDVDRAIRGCTNIITAGPESHGDLATVYLIRALAYQQKGDVDRAVADYENAIELDPNQFAVYYAAGLLHGRKGEYDREIADETKAIELNPQFALAYANRGIAYGKTGNPDREIADETKAIELNPQLVEAYLNRGAAYGHKGSYDQALADESKAIDLKPDDGYGYYGRGVINAVKGDPAKALADFRAAAQLAPPSDPLRDDALARAADLEKQFATAVPVVVVPHLMSQATAAVAGHRVALVIGNSAYQNVPALNNPANDAHLIAGALISDGFTVTVAGELGHEGFITALKTFAKAADTADWAVVYFAGHGIEMGGTNYLIPVDAKLATDRDVNFEAIPIDQVMSALDGARNLRVVILDAYRNNPFVEMMRRGTGVFRNVGRGLARIEPTQGTVIVYSARPGQVAADGDGADSPFAVALAHHLTDPGVEVLKLFRLVRDDVLAATGNGQEVFQDSSLPGTDFFFRPH
jgi:tetratricopeptide (TPR) repeat protein